MKPAPFDYAAPATVDEAVTLLAARGDEAKILAGGQSLVPMMNFRLVRPAYLIDINRIDSLAGIAERDGRLHIGAMTRHRAVERSALVGEKNGLLAEGVRLIGHAAIRSRGTVGGSIVHADPTAELPAILAALDGAVKVVGPNGRRTIGWRDLFQTYFTTSLEPSEICEEVIIPTLPPGAGWAFEEFARRHGDFAVVGIAVVLWAEGGRCTEARIAVTGAGPTPVRATEAEACLTGEAPTPALFEEAGRRVVEAVEPDADLHASEAYRRHLAKVLTVRALRRAAARLA